MFKIQYIGQNGFVISNESVRICFDPYLSNHVYEQTGEMCRQYDPPCGIEDIADVDYYFISHNHMDHMDIPTIQALTGITERTKFICPYPCIGELEKNGIAVDKIVGAKALNRIDLGYLEVFPIPEKHEDYLIVDGEHSFLGYVIRWDGCTFYHAGDAIADKELVNNLSPFRGMDVMFLPINGHDWKRYENDVMGNMTYREALDLANETGTDLVVPMHYDLFKENSENPAFFVDYLYRTYPFQKFKMFMPGELVWYSGGERK